MARLHALAALAALALLAALLAACGTATPSAAPPTIRPTQLPSASPPPASPSPAPSGTFAAPATGFAFDAESVIGYYRSVGYACGDWAPSTQAAGHEVNTCRLVDPDGRTRVIGVVTDPAGHVADGFASVQGRDDEVFLDPTVALEPLAGFLGAMLGEARGSALVPWLAGHLGDEHAETRAADLHVATYLGEGGNRSVLVVEVANDAYLVSPRPTSSSG